MRSFLSKALTGSMIAGAALAISACGPKAETTADNTMVTDLNSTEGMDTMSDNMTAVDGAMNGGTMANDSMGMDNGGMMANDSMMSSNSMTTTTTGNGM